MWSPSKTFVDVEPQTVNININIGISYLKKPFGFPEVFPYRTDLLWICYILHLLKAQSSFRPREKSSRGTVGHIPTGVRDGRDATLLFQL